VVFGFDAFIATGLSKQKTGTTGYVRNILESVVDFRSEEYEITTDMEPLPSALPPHMRQCIAVWQRRAYRTGASMDTA
jgi:hypothetical protein